jgi:hypothetical protein
MKVELKRGFPRLDELTNVFVGGDDGTWEGFVRYNTESAEMLDVNKRPFSCLTRDELTSLADFCLEYADSLKNIRISDYFFQIGTKKVAFGPRNWKAFWLRLDDYKKKRAQ